MRLFTIALATVLAGLTALNALTAPLHHRACDDDHGAADPGVSCVCLCQLATVVENDPTVATIAFNAPDGRGIPSNVKFADRITDSDIDRPPISA